MDEVTLDLELMVVSRSGSPVAVGKRDKQIRRSR
jgi:hypothetical protein